MSHQHVNMFLLFAFMLPSFLSAFTLSPAPPAVMELAVWLLRNKTVTPSSIYCPYKSLGWFPSLHH